MAGRAAIPTTYMYKNRHNSTDRMTTKYVCKLSRNLFKDPMKQLLIKKDVY